MKTNYATLVIINLFSHSFLAIEDIQNHLFLEFLNFNFLNKLKFELQTSNLFLMTNFCQKDKKINIKIPK